MKLQDLINRLEEYKTKIGDVDVSVSCDQELNAEGSPTDRNICFMEWSGETDKTEALMICDSYTFSELQS